jgi:hypothetical protein
MPLLLTPSGAAASSVVSARPGRFSASPQGKPSRLQQRRQHFWPPGGGALAQVPAARLCTFTYILISLNSPNASSRMRLGRAIVGVSFVRVPPRLPAFPVDGPMRGDRREQPGAATSPSSRLLW